MASGAAEDSSPTWVGRGQGEGLVAAAPLGLVRGAGRKEVLGGVLGGVHGPSPEGTIGRFSKQSGGKVQIPCLDLVKRDKQGMGGVDLLGSSVAN